MTNASKEDKKAFTTPLVKKVSIPDTLRLIPHGRTARYAHRDMYIGSVRSSITRLNKEAGRTEYELCRVDGMDYFEVIHH